MAGRFTSYAKDRFMAPFLSQFTHANIPDVSSCSTSAGYWISNFVLNSMFRGTVEETKRQLIFNFLRRTEGAFEEYGLARAATVSFLAGSRQSPSLYMKAMRHWENFLMQAWHGRELLAAALEIAKVFDKESDSQEKRLNQLYNESKHAESVIQRGQMLPYATVPVWLTNAGLQGREAALSFMEAADIATGLSHWADNLQDPAGFAARLRAGEFSNGLEQP